MDIKSAFINLALLLSAMLFSGGSLRQDGVSLPSKLSALRGAMLAADGLSVVRLRGLRAQGYTAIVLMVDGSRSDLQTARRLPAVNLDIYYWIEVGRSPAMADAHPEWMASLQGHPEWRRLFPKFPNPTDGEVVKNYPWVPILYQESFDAQVQRVAKLLRDLPPAKGVFLNDLQAAPSACGCGNDLCRWTADYGPIKTATPMGSGAAARFVYEIRKVAKGAEVIPVWTTECEEHEKPTHCAGIGCFEGTCWYELTAQLVPVAEQCPRIGVLAPYKAFLKDDPNYRTKAGWVKEALASLSLMPPKRKGKPVAPGRLIAVLQGWDVSPSEIYAQIQQASQAGAAGSIVSMVKVDQSWEPRIVKAGVPK